jgi:hypothetical protein
MPPSPIVTESAVAAQFLSDRLARQAAMPANAEALR